MGENSTSRGAVLPLYFSPSVCLMNSSRSCLNFAEPVFAAERFVVTEEGQDHVGLDRLEMIVGAAEIGRPQPQRQLVARKTEIADDQLVARKAAVQQAPRTCRSAASDRPACCR